MKIVIDCREQTLIKLLTNDVQNSKQFFKKEVTVETSNLPIGDLIIYGDDDKELLIFERKSISDLASSIGDGWYNEQSFRLNEHPIPNHNIVYLIEGDFDKIKSYGRIDSRALHSSIFNLLYYKGFSVYRTFNIYETSNLVCRFVDKLWVIGYEKTKDLLPALKENHENFKDFLPEHSQQFMNKYLSITKDL